MLTIEGDYQEGGGQMVRSSLALSALTGKAFRLVKIRAKRSKPGLKAQHLAAIRLLSSLCKARVEGAELHSSEIVFEPGPLQAGEFKVEVGTAGSVCLLLQAALLPALHSPGPVNIKLVGGTDAKWAPPVAYVQQLVLPHYRVFGSAELKVQRHGFFPKGGGKLHFECHPAQGSPVPLQLTNCSAPRHIKGLSVASSSLQDKRVAERQAASAEQHLGDWGCPIEIATHYTDSLCGGSSLTLWSDHQNYRIGADQLGERGRPAEKVGRATAQLLNERLKHTAPVDEHLTDHLVPLLSLVGGEVRSQELTPHTLSNLYVCSQFGGRAIDIEGDRLVAN